MTGKQTETGKIVLGWWRQSLRPESETGAVRGFRARLRRAHGLLEIVSEPQFIALHDDLAAAWKKRPDPVALAALAHLLASVKKNAPHRIAQIFGMGDRPALSQLRFQHLIRTDALPELGEDLRRALPMIDYACNVAALADDFLNWNEQTRARWCFDYFGKASPETPAAAPEMEETE